MRLSRFVKAFQLVEKVYFYKYRANSLSLTPNPFPVGRGYITGATAPRPCRGLRPCDPIFIIDRGFSTVCKAFTFCESLLLLYKPENLKCRNSAYADNTADDIERLCAFLTDKTDKEKRYHYHRLYE